MLDRSVPDVNPSVRYSLRGALCDIVSVGQKFPAGA